MVEFDRLWRKTRSPQGDCFGVDPNRNFDIAFRGPGSSSNPCSDRYAGSTPFSEVESKNVKDAILNIKQKNKLLGYVSFHSYSQMILTPYGFTRMKPRDHNETMRVAESSRTALNHIHGKHFDVGSPADILYPASGGSKDWAKVRAGVKYAYTFELRPEKVDDGQNGFLLSEHEIFPSAEEMWAALLALAREIQLN